MLTGRRERWGKTLNWLQANIICENSLWPTILVIELRSGCVTSGLKRKIIIRIIIIIKFIIILTMDKHLKMEKKMTV